jgi:hypothetical protein
MQRSTAREEHAIPRRQGYEAGLTMPERSPGLPPNTVNPDMGSNRGTGSRRLA